MNQSGAEKCQKDILILKNPNIAATKTAVAAIKGITAAIVAGGWIVVVVILLLCAVGMAVGRMVGADFSGSELPQITEDWESVISNSLLTSPTDCSILKTTQKKKIEVKRCCRLL